MPESLIQRSFVGGELSPAMGARADTQRYLASLGLCQNFIVLQQGGVQKRSGFRYLATAKVPSQAPRLFPFIFEAADQTYVIEAGDLYFRFFWHGAPVMSASFPYEVATPYVLGDVHRLRIAQSADTIVITHPSYAPRELKRLGHTNWSLSVMTFDPPIAAPTNLTAGYAPGNTGSLNMRYVVTAVQSGTYEESYASIAAVAAGGGEPTKFAPNVLTWDLVSGAIEYRVYCDPMNNGVFGYLGTQTQVWETSSGYADDGTVPNFSVTPPQPKLNPVIPGQLASAIFTGTDNYPSVCRYFQQRLWFGNTNSNRETVWGSRIGRYKNFSLSSPLQDDDSVEFVIAGDTISPIAHLLGLKNLIVMSDTGEFRAKGDETGAILPSAIGIDQEGYIGVDPGVIPVVLGNTTLFVQARGTAVRETRFDVNVGGLLGAGDLTVFAGHLFRGYKLLDQAFTLIPHSVDWVVRDDGILLGLTYVPEAEVLAWHRHVTGGRGEPGCADNHYFKGLCVVPDTGAGEDVLYAVVQRIIGGQTVYYIEMLETAFHPERTPIEEAFFVDSGLSYSGVPASTFTGLSHLEGEVVAVLADGQTVYDGDLFGAEAAQYTVTGGSITIPFAASTVHIGLRIASEIETLDLDAPGTSLRAKRKKPQALDLLVYGTNGEGLYVGPDRAHLLQWRREPWQLSQTWWTGLLSMNLTAHYGDSGRLLVQHRFPLPCTLVGLIPSVEVGG